MSFPTAPCGPPSASAGTRCRWWRSRCCSAGTSASGSRTICTSRRACSRATASSSRRRSRSSSCSAPAPSPPRKRAPSSASRPPDRPRFREDLPTREAGRNRHRRHRQRLGRIQARCRHPERVLIGHPFNPVYLLPLVEVVAGELTKPVAVKKASAFYRRLGMRPLHVQHEIAGYISDRLQEALWREALHLVADGVATTEEIDSAIVFGPGLRWAFMGTFLAFHLAGGDGGMRHMLEQFGPALKLPWTKLRAPELTTQLARRVVSGTKAQANGRSVKELGRWRDDQLIRIMSVTGA